MGLYRVAPPQGDVIPIEVLRRQLRVDSDEQDDEIRAFAASVVSSLEGDGTGLESCWLGRVLLPQSWVLTLDGFPGGTGGFGSLGGRGAIPLPLAPVIEIEGITYLDADGNAQTLDGSKYRLLADRLPAEVIPAYGESWPATLDDQAVVSVRFRAGYAGGEELDSPPGSSAVPPAIQQAIKLIVGDFFAMRETVNVGNIVNELPWTASVLLTPFRTGLARIAWQDGGS